MNILVRVPNWLGDAVMSLPFIESLTVHWPEVSLDIIASPGVADVFRHHCAVSRVHLFEKKKARGMGGMLKFGRQIGNQRTYAAFITLAPSFSSALVGWAACRRQRIGYRGEWRRLLLSDAITAPDGVHRVQSYCHLLRCLPRGDALLSDVRQIPPVRFPFSADEQNTTICARLENTIDIVFNINSQAPSRRLPLATWKALGNRLLADQQVQRRIIFVGTASEQPGVARVMAAIHHQDKLLDFTGRTNLRQLAILLRDADYVITNDSGPMHLANAVGTPLIAFFGAGNMAETGPFNDADAITINHQVACSPCVKNQCRYSTLHCLEEISVEEIFSAAMALEQRLRSTAGLVCPGR